MLDLKNETDDLVLLENAIVVPPGPQGRGRWQPSGVLTAEGAIVDNSISWTSSTEPVNSAPPMPALEEIVDLPGTHIFGGISYGHFGHFITESLARIWALEGLRDKVDGFIFTPKAQSPNIQRPFEVYHELIEAMGANIPMLAAAEPLRVERLYVPKQGFGLNDLMGGSAKFRDYVRNYAGRDIEPKGAEKVYISRSRLPKDRGGLVGEWKLEQYLIAEGYHIFHPQRETKTDQLAQYKAARKLLAVDCSPLHLVGYVGNANQTVGILNRRSMKFGNLFVTQLNGFHGINCKVIDTLLNDWLPANTNRPSRSSFGEVSLRAMYHDLKSAGLIEGNTEWEDLSVDERNADLHRIESLYEMAFRPLKADDSFMSSRQ